MAVCTHKDVTQLVGRLRGERIHRVEELEVYALDQGLLAGFETHLTRRTAFSVTVAERHLYLTVGWENLTAVIERVELMR